MLTEWFHFPIWCHSFAKPVLELRDLQPVVLKWMHSCWTFTYVFAMLKTVVDVQHDFPYQYFHFPIPKMSPNHHYPYLITVLLTGKIDNFEKSRIISFYLLTFWNILISFRFPSNLLNFLQICISLTFPSLCLNFPQKGNFLQNGNAVSPFSTINFHIIFFKVQLNRSTIAAFFSDLVAKNWMFLCFKYLLKFMLKNSFPSSACTFFGYFPNFFVELFH